jgi:agmatine deiminase
MPVQVSESKFVQFSYDPSYLQSPKYRGTITDVDSVCDSLGITVTKSAIKIDGGNVIKGKNWAILTDRIFSENSSVDRTTILKELEQLLEAKPIIVPTEPGDYLGHADGIIRRFDEETLIINSYQSKSGIQFSKKLESALKTEGFRIVKIPNGHHNAVDKNSADGYYINYLQMRGVILLPAFGLNEDEVAFNVVSDLFPNHHIESIAVKEISKEGGVLNCISWSVFQ